MKTTYTIPACRQVLVLQADGMCEDVKFVPLHFSVSLLSRHWHSVHKLPTVVHITLTHVTVLFLQPVCYEKDFWGEDTVYAVSCVNLMKTNSQYCKSLPLCCWSEYLGEWCSGTCCLGAECTCVLTEVEPGHYSRHGWQPQLPSRCLYIWLLHKWSICSN